MFFLARGGPADRDGASVTYARKGEFFLPEIEQDRIIGFRDLLPAENGCAAVQKEHIVVLDIRWLMLKRHIFF